MSNTTLESTVTVPSPSAKVATKPDFGNGRYSKEMERLFSECKNVLGLSPEKSEKIARQAATDIGNVFANGKNEIRISKASKDGKVTMGEVTKMKGVTMTPALRIVRALEWMGDAGKNGISYGNTTWALSYDEPFQDWIDSL